MISVATALFKALEAEGVDRIFGYPGGQALPLYDALYDFPGIQHVLTRHEQGAIHAAQGYARATGRTGVVLVTSGPGATNLITGLADALMDSTPIVAISGQVSRQLMGRDAFQEADVVGMTMPVTKHNFLVLRPEDLLTTIKQAFYIAGTGRKGPVLIDIPKDVATSQVRFDYPASVRLRGYQPFPAIDQGEIARAAEALMAAERPVAVVGGGVLASEGAPLLARRLIETLRIPTVQTLMGLDCFPQSHPLSLGLLGMHGSFAANRAVAHADLLLAVGARFGDRVTGNAARFAPRAKVIHIDLDPSEISKNIEAHFPVVGDCAQALGALAGQVGEQQAGPRTEWLEQIKAWQDQHPLWGERGTPAHDQLPGDPPKPQQVLRVLQEIFGPSAVVVTDVGQHQMWAAHYLKREEPRTWISSCGLGTMGFGLPAAVGAAFGVEGAREVVLVTGDGSLQMTYQELATVAAWGLPVKIVILNNGCLGLVRQQQELFFRGRYSGVALRPGSPDFVTLAAAYGIRGVRVDRLEEVRGALQSLREHDGPMLVEVQTADRENVFPMVPPGAANVDALVRAERG